LGIVKTGLKERLGITEKGKTQRALLGAKNLTASQMANLTKDAYKQADARIKLMIEEGGLINPLTQEELSPQEIEQQRELIARDLMEKYLGRSLTTR